ncbi:MAG: hypothetical protein ACR2QM_13755 [Longimicrobiales bacterium]
MNVAARSGVCDGAALGLTVLALLAGSARPAASQDVATEMPARLALFLDCDFCDESFIRQEVTYVDHVRDREVAGVHVLVTQQETAAGGEAQTFDLIGLGPFEGIDFSTVYTTNVNATEAEERDGFLRTLRAVLVPYLLRTSMSDRLRIDIDPAADEVGEQAQRQEDPWDFWTVEMYADGSADFESNQRSFDTRYGVYVDRITEDWKLQFRPFFNYNYDRFERQDETIESTQRRNGFTSYVVRSVSPHWSIGGFGDVLTSTFSNIDLRFRLMPALEWSLYPYREATRRQLTIAYRVGASHIAYQDTTIYDETEQLLPEHLINAGYEVIQPWGEVDIGVGASQYLHDLSRLSVQFDGAVEVRVTQGLSIEIGGSLELIHNQLNLPKGDADLEEVLLRRRQLETNYEAGLSFGFRYRFGSIFNNVVNSRFGGIGNRDRF